MLTATAYIFTSSASSLQFTHQLAIASLVSACLKLLCCLPSSNLMGTREVSLLQPLR